LKHRNDGLEEAASGGVAAKTPGGAAEISYCGEYAQGVIVGGNHWPARIAWISAHVDF
jgi:hypothetical protein